MLGLDFTVMVSSFEEREQMDPSSHPGGAGHGGGAGEGGRGFSPYLARAPETADGL